MKKTRDELIFNLKASIAKLTPFLEDCKINSNYLDLPDGYEKLPYHDILEGVKWLENIPIIEYLKARNMMSDETRERLIKIGMYGQHRYFVTLNIKRKELFKAVRSTKKPNIFKKDYVKRKLKSIDKDNNKK